MGLIQKILLTVAAFVLCGSLYAGALHAEQMDGKAVPEKFMLDGREYTKERLIEDFINIAFSKKDWPVSNDSQNSFTKRSIGKVIFDYLVGASPRVCCTPSSEEKMLNRSQIPGYLSQLPSMSEYLFRPNGIPNREGIYKWTRQKVGIGFDWPQYTTQHWGGGIGVGVIDPDTGLPIQYVCGITIENCEDLYKITKGEYQDIVDHINALIPELEKITGLDLRLQMPGDENEKTENYARIRIIPVRTNLQKNFFKMYRYGILPPPDNFHVIKYEPYFIGAVSYTTDVRSQVDGYLLPDADNSLGLSTCKIMPVVGREIMKALVTECLLRALGLPDISKYNDHAMLGNWNKEYDSFSKLEDFDDREEALRLVPDPDHFVPDDDIPKEAEFPKIDKDLQAFMSFSDYDKMMAKLLYCPAVKAGMKKEQVRDVLVKTDACFSKENKGERNQ